MLALCHMCPLLRPAIDATWPEEVLDDCVACGARAICQWCMSAHPCQPTRTTRPTERAIATCEAAHEASDARADAGRMRMQDVPCW